MALISGNDRLDEHEKTKTGIPISDLAMIVLNGLLGAGYVKKLWDLKSFPYY
ncbi:MAG: hypothetical protein AB7V04_08585 [Desulfomonilaceae bacterium]